MDNPLQEILLKPIGMIHCSRNQAIDDYWGDVVSVIELDSKQFTEESILGLEQFSHIEVLFYMNLVEMEKIEKKARHPRDNTQWPRVGIFAQRAKGRPNCLGVSRCRLLKINGLTLTVLALDAIDKTPVLDIKPYIREYGPSGQTYQPSWASELMTNYYSEKPSNSKTTIHDYNL